MDAIIMNSMKISILIATLVLLFAYISSSIDLHGFEIADPAPDISKQLEEAVDTPEEKKILEELERDSKDSGIWETLIRPNRELMLDHKDLPLRLEARILGREVMNYIRWKRPDIATIKLNNLKKILPDSDETHYLTGALYFTYGNWEDSEKELLQALSIHPKHDPALFLLGCVYAMKEEWNQSQDYTERAIRQAPYSPYYRMNLAYIHFILNNQELAYREIQTLLKQKPNFENAFVLAKLMGYPDWNEEFSKIRFIGRDTRIYLENGFPSDEAKVRYVLERFYTFYPIITK